jgi:hypothetical protein
VSIARCVVTFSRAQLVLVLNQLHSIPKSRRHFCIPGLFRYLPPPFSPRLYRDLLKHPFATLLNASSSTPHRAVPGAYCERFTTQSRPRQWSSHKFVTPQWLKPGSAPNSCLGLRYIRNLVAREKTYILWHVHREKCNSS